LQQRAHPTKQHVHAHTELLYASNTDKNIDNLWAHEPIELEHPRRISSRPDGVIDPLCQSKGEEIEKFMSLTLFTLCRIMALY